MKTFRMIIAMGTAFVAGTLAIAACSTSSNPGTPLPSGDAGYVTPGAADMHCVGPDGGITIQTVSQASCFVDDAGMPSGDDAGDDGGGDDGAMVSDYGPTMYGSEGDDDDCKYHVVWSSTPLYENYNVTFTVTVTELDTGMPVTGLEIADGPTHKLRLEVYLNDTHPAPNSTQVVTATGTPGQYTVAVIQFDAPGVWTTRFHIHEECYDILDDSPHGHAAFFMTLP